VLIAGLAKRVSYRQIADNHQQRAGRPIHHDEPSPDTWHAGLVTTSVAKGVPNGRDPDHLVAQAVALHRPTTHVLDHVRCLAGREIPFVPL
jgi:hypothetical protein